MHNFLSVSYTHLDVYKRQGLYNAYSGIIKTVNGFKDVIGKTSESLKEVHIVGWNLSIIYLLYTSAEEHGDYQDHTLTLRTSNDYDVNKDGLT